eukprot:INCI4340.1.p3 GENE.INCI4340.1~~INCI4340.1.p3  ORF type:complete len:157 (-),score=49.28 INCI4340.1:2226-2696(-)
MAGRPVEDPDVDPVDSGDEDDDDVSSSSSEETDSEEEDDESDYYDDDDEDGGVKGAVKAIYRNTVGIFADPLGLYSDKDEHSLQIKKRQQNRARVQKYWSMGGSVAWAASVTMVVVVFPILVVAQRDNMIKELREQQQRQQQQQMAGMPGLQAGGL